jgi:hypothetical protein
MHVRAIVLVVGCAALGLLAGCRQEGELAFPPIPPVAAQNPESVDVTLGPMALWLAGSAIEQTHSGDAQAKRMLQGLKLVKVRAYNLPPDNPLPAQQLATLRSQLSAPGWSPLVQTHDRDTGEDVAIYIEQQGNDIHGLAVVALTRTEVTIVNVVGTINREDITALARMARHARKGDIQGLGTED